MPLPLTLWKVGDVMVVMSQPSKTRVDPRMRSRWATLPALGVGAPADAGSVRFVAMGKGSTCARRHMSASPRAQCMASHARQGTPSSTAMGFQSSDLSLEGMLAGLVRRGEGRAWFVFPVVEFGKEIRIIPIVDSGELIALLLAPVGPLLEVVLVVQSAADGATAWYLTTDVVPFHATATEYDDLGVFGWCPLASGLAGGVRSVVAARWGPLGRRCSWIQTWILLKHRLSCVGEWRRRWLLWGELLRAME